MFSGTLLYILYTIKEYKFVLNILLCFLYVFLYLFIYISYTEIYILLFCATLQNDHNINLFQILGSWQRLYYGKEGRRKGKEEKGEIIFSKSLFLKISSNNEPHKIPVLSPDSQTWQSSQASAADHRRGNMPHNHLNIT